MHWKLHNEGLIILVACNFLASKKNRVIREIRAKKKVKSVPKEKSVILNNDNKESLTP